jgi:WhiB family redox-sensing transcriptional regulator
MSTIREAGPPPIGSWPPQACTGKDTAMFFPVKAGSVVEYTAKQWCRICQARPACLAYALPIEDLAGVWAG